MVYNIIEILTKYIVQYSRRIRAFKNAEFFNVKTTNYSFGHKYWSPWVNQLGDIMLIFHVIVNALKSTFLRAKKIA